MPDALYISNSLTSHKDQLTCGSKLVLAAISNPKTSKSSQDWPALPTNYQFQCSIGMPTPIITFQDDTLLRMNRVPNLYKNPLPTQAKTPELAATGPLAEQNEARLNIDK